MQEKRGDVFFVNTVVGLLLLSVLLSRLGLSTSVGPNSDYRKTSDRSPRLLLVQFTLTPGLYPGPGV